MAEMVKNRSSLWINLKALPGKSFGRKLADNKQFNSEK